MNDDDEFGDADDSNHAQRHEGDDAAADDLDGDDDDIRDEDLDAFLVNLEARLRADFTSFDLSSVISSQGSSTSSSSVNNYLNRGNNSSSASISTPSRFLRLMQKVFSRAAKPIKLRALMSVMGLDDDDHTPGNHNNTDNSSRGDKEDGRKTDAIVWRLLSHAIKKDDEVWVRVVAGIIRSIMFRRCRRRKFANNGSGSSYSNLSNDDNDHENDNDNNHQDEEMESERQLRKITSGILQGVQEACLRADARFEEAAKQYHHLQQQEQHHQMEDQQQQQVGKELATLLIGADLDPFYVPLRYNLLSTAVLRSILPELDFHHDITSIKDAETQGSPPMHFTPNMDATILNVDDSYEEEEGTALAAVGRGVGGFDSSSLQQPQNGAMNGSGISRGYGSATPGGLMQQSCARGEVGRSSMSGRFASAGRGSGPSSSFLFRPSSKNTVAAGRGGAATTTTAGGGRMVGGRVGGRSLGRDGGRTGSLSRLLVAGGGRGRGAVATATTSSSLAAPLHRRVQAQAVLNEGGRGGMGGTKMKMIDVSEVEGLNRAQAEREKNDGIGGTSSLSSVQARKLERKRKLLEDAAASGLRNPDRKKTTALGDGYGAGGTAVSITTTASVSQSEGNSRAMSEKQSH